MNARAILCLAAAALFPVPSAAQETGPAHLFADVRTGADARYAGTYGFAEVGDRAVFVRADHEIYPALWATDGTAGGTELLQVMCFPCSDIRLVGTNGSIAFYLAISYVSPLPDGRLWRTDGTLAGTVPVGPAFWLPALPALFQSVVGTTHAYFTACSPAENCTLWTSDGTDAGTMALAWPEEDSPRSPKAFVTSGDRAYLLTGRGNDTKLYTASPQGIALVAPTPGGTLLTAIPGGGVAFIARDDGFEVWTSFGSPAGTRAVTRFVNPAPFPVATPLLAVESTLYFIAADGSGRQIWRTDPQAERGARRMTSLKSAQPYGVQILGHARRALLFSTLDSNYRQHLWTLGIDSGLAKPLFGCPGGCPTPIGSDNAALPDGRLVLFGQHAGGNGFWVSDGTAAGTRVLARPQPSYWTLAQLEAIGDRVFMVYTEEYEVGQLWVTDGSRNGTFQATEGGPGWSHYFGWRGSLDAAAAGSEIVFASSAFGADPLWSAGRSQASNGPILPWREARGSEARLLGPLGDGVLAETCRQYRDKSLVFVREGESVALLRTRADYCDLRLYSKPVVLAQNRLVFNGPRGLDANSPRAIFATDGTPAGTVALADAVTGEPGDPVPFGEFAVFPVFRGIDQAAEIWITDGTVASTQRLIQLAPNQYLADQLSYANGKLFYFAHEADGSRPWVTDGTPQGTQLLHSTYQARFLGSQPFVALDGWAYFVFAPGDDQARTEIWRSNGTPAGTSLAVSASTIQSPSSLQAAAGRLYLLGQLPGSETNLSFPYVSDGSEAGSERLVAATVDPNEILYAPESWRFAELDGAVYFAAVDAARGDELFRSEGTAAGTASVRDIMPGDQGSFPRELTAWQNKLWFRARDREHGMELWSTDGTPTATRPVQDISRGPSWSNPRFLLLADERLFFAANDGAHGREPWVLEASELP